MPKKGYKATKEHKRKIHIAMKSKNRFGENNPNFKGGKPKCLDCGKEINYISSRCKSCSKKGENNPAKRLEVREKISVGIKEVMSRPGVREEISKGRLGILNPRYGKHHSNKTKQKMREKRIQYLQIHPEVIEEISKMNFGKHPSELTIQKMSEKRIQYLQNHHGPYKDTKPELKMKDILIELSIPYETQFRVGNHVADFHFLNTNILAEVDGDYWHGNPKKFSKLNKRQQKQKQKDIKNDQLAKEKGYIVLRFWENDILNDKGSVKEKLCKEVL